MKTTKKAQYTFVLLAAVLVWCSCSNRYANMMSTSRADVGEYDSAVVFFDENVKDDFVVPEEDASDNYTRVYAMRPNVGEASPRVSTRSAVVVEEGLDSNESPGDNKGVVSQKTIDSFTSKGGMNLKYDAVMKQGETYLIEASIFKLLKSTVLKQADGAVHETIPLKVSAVMKVELFAPNFKIVPRHDTSEKFIDEQGSTVWAWDVTPLKSGNQSIDLTASVCILLPGYGKQFKPYQVLKKEIVVEVDAIEYVKNGFVENWKWGAALVAIAGLTISVLNYRNAQAKRSA